MDKLFDLMKIPALFAVMTFGLLFVRNQSPGMRRLVWATLLLQLTLLGFLALQIPTLEIGLRRVPPLWGYTALLYNFIFIIGYLSWWIHFEKYRQANSPVNRKEYRKRQNFSGERSLAIKEKALGNDHIASMRPWNSATKPKEEKPQKMRSVLPRRATEFDIRYMKLKKIDRKISELKKFGPEKTKTRKRIENLKKMSEQGWHALYIDIINREG
jgi:hypothetical protein